MAEDERKVAIIAAQSGSQSRVQSQITRRMEKVVVWLDSNIMEVRVIVVVEGKAE